jgi:glycosyltransferase involved in cell wall biosynthesis
MADQFQTPEPGVIYNTFERASMPSISSPCGEVPRLHWFSLVIGPERGLEGLFQALGFVRGGWRLSLRGEGGSDYIGHLLNVLPEPQRSRVEVLPLVPTAELPRALAMHDIGFATEQAAIPSRNLTVTNKLFHYLHSGLIVLATPTDGQREVLGSFDGLSECVRFDRPREAALAIDRWLERRAGFGDLRKAVQARFRETFAWDTLLPVYSRHITGALEGEPACESS